MTRPSDPLVLSPDETRKEEEFLASPRVPRRMERLIEEYITKKTGKAWNDPVILGRIREAVVTQKGRYWAKGKKRKIAYGRGYDVLAYLSYHFPVYLVQFELLFHEMVQDGLIPRNLRVLDAGSGPGVVSLAIADYYGRLDVAQASITAIDRSDENTEAYTALVHPYGEKKGQVAVSTPLLADLKDKIEVAGPYDLIVFSNVLNEIAGLDTEGKADLVARYAALLSPEGSVILIEPAEKEGSTALREVQAALTSRGLPVYAPCTPLWGEICRPDRCWTFVTGPDVKPPRLMEALATGEEGYRFMNTDIKYSYAILRKDDLTRISYRIGKQDKAARLGSLASHVGRQIHVRAARMSPDIGDEKRHVVKICDGTTKTPVYAVLPVYARTEENEALISGKYGEILSIRNAGVRYNREADTYSIIIGRKTTVTPIGKGCGA
ncbi:MAG: small ribosomal subunit Rsm22 family protein [Methanofollis sp.]|uniref:small ribosomal subunit Rsm22 family protein n=1 Tax=Methanofollis sp. TaxID=2052835 RepID=UPI002613FD03|nr:small ribosomal subunit Rsm22 family protein [Methanofollis sp.]MDD4254641.1 small ribosomal subunit Rsm22 family protein [Methanofollis sp.]